MCRVRSQSKVPNTAISVAAPRLLTDRTGTCSRTVKPQLRVPETRAGASIDAVTRPAIVAEHGMASPSRSSKGTWDDHARQIGRPYTQILSYKSSAWRSFNCIGVCVPTCEGAKLLHAPGGETWSEGAPWILREHLITLLQTRREPTGSSGSLYNCTVARGLH